MWELLAAEPVADPGLPYQAIGTVLVALVTGMTAIIVAILQKNKTPAAATPPAGTPPTTAGSFVLSETEWIETRNRAIRAEAAVLALRDEYNTHEQVSQEHMGRTNANIEYLKGRVGPPV